MSKEKETGDSWAKLPTSIRQNINHSVVWRQLRCAIQFENRVNAFLDAAKLRKAHVAFFIETKNEMVHSMSGSHLENRRSGSYLLDSYIYIFKNPLSFSSTVPVYEITEKGMLI